MPFGPCSCPNCKRRQREWPPACPPGSNSHARSCPIAATAALVEVNVNQHRDGRLTGPSAVTVAGLADRGDNRSHPYVRWDYAEVAQ